MKQYPLPTPMATDETLIGLYARTAPDMPDWFEGELLTDEPELISGLFGEWSKTPEYFDWEKRNTESIYFQWRLYYAKKMIELLNKK